MTRSLAWARTWTALRAVMAVAIIAAIVAQLTASLATGAADGKDLATIWTNFFSFFTILSNALAAIVLLWAVVSFVRAGKPYDTGRVQHPESRALAVSVACISTYMIITGIVYNALLRGITLPQGSEPIPWSNEVLHLIGPLFLLADVFLAPRRRALSWSTIWIVIAFPIAWVIYTMLRGPLITSPATGTPYWYPYPFLNPNNPGGWGSVVIYVIIISIAFVVVGSFVIWWGRRMARTAPPAE